MSMLARNDGPAAAELLDSPAANRLTELTSLMVEATPTRGGRAPTGGGDGTGAVKRAAWRR
jgi:hypothetical protein